ncbi:MAG: MerR family transcriptional regulator [Clostridiales bacterium]|nr:MerR family transcriptional regulator [Clostridiales bacterium]
MQRLSIGEMAHMNQTSVETLRHYEKLGLLIPDHIDEKTNYRYYLIEQSAKLDMIIHMRNLGLPLSVIKQQLEQENMSFIQATLAEQLQHINDKIDELAQIKHSIEKSMKGFDEFCRAPKAPEIVLEHIPERRILVYDEGVDFHQLPFSEFEIAARSLKKTVLMNNLPMSYFCNVGDIIRKSTLEQKKTSLTALFVFIEDENEINGKVEVLPESDYACIYFDDYTKGNEYVERIMDFINNKGYDLNGDFICEVVADMPYYRRMDRKLFMKAQMPII